MEKKFYEFLSKENCILALVDHQVGLLAGVRDIDPDLLKRNLIGLAQVAKVANIPVILTTSIEEGPNGPFWQEILDILPDAKYIARPGEINAWENPEFKKAIEESGRKKIILAGIVTDICLLFPAISAVSEGYDVYAVIDASGTWNKLVQEATMHRLSQVGAKVTTWAGVLAEIMHDWRDEKGMELGTVLANNTPYGYVYANYLASKKES